MTTNVHTDITVGAPANASIFNAPLGQLDAAISALAFNVKYAPYNAKGDGQTITNGVMNGTTAVLTSVSNPFVAGDVGKQIDVNGAGAAGVALATTIASYQNPGQVTLAAASSTAVGAATVCWFTDDTAAIQAAINAIPTQGGIVYFPAVAGYYGITTTLTCTKNNTTFVGDGRQASTIRRKSLVNVAMLAITGAQNCLVEALAFDQNGLNNTGINKMAVYPDINAHNCTIRRCAFLNSTGFAIIVNGGLPTARVNNLRILENDFIPDVSSAGDVCTPVSVGGITWGNRFTIASGLALNVYESNDHPAIGNTFIGSGLGGQGLAVSSCLNCPVIGNTFSLGNNDTGILVKKETDNGGARNQTQAQIIGNSLRGTGGTPLAMSIQNASGIQISSNVFDGLTWGIGYDISAIDNVQIFNNLIIGGMDAAHFQHGAITPTNVTTHNNVGLSGNGLTGSLNGYDHELALGAGATTGPTSAISDAYTGAGGTMFFDHRGTGNTGLWKWRNGTNGAFTAMQLTALGVLNFTTTQNVKQSPAFAASPAPDFTLGGIFAPAAMTGNVTVANPTNSAQGMRVIMVWTQDGTGGRTVTYSGTNWRSVGIAAQVTTLSTVTIDEAVCVDGTIWRVNRLVTGQTI